jgi:hypothetical protein
MKTIEFEINGHSYKAGRISLGNQFHIARKLAPLADVIADGSPDEGVPLGAFLRGIRDLPDTDVEFVLSTCLAVVQSHRDGGWQRVSAGGMAMMFDDIELPEMLGIVWHVVRGHLAGFFPGGLPDLTAVTTSRQA